VATLREHFSDVPGTSFPTEQELSLQPKDGRPPITVVARLYRDFASHTRYVAFFIQQGQYSFEAAALLSQFPVQVVDQISNEIQITTSHPAAYGEEESTSLPFSGRVHLYIDDYVPDADKSQLVSAAAGAGIALNIKDRKFSDYLTATEKPRAFISHDSRDKPFVRELAEKLRAMRCPVWYDEFSLKVGDSLRESIDTGLKEAPKCIVVLSPHFLGNPGWTKAEFNAAMHKHIASGGSVILPIWHNVSRADVADYSPLIVDTVALKSDIDIDELTRNLFLVINQLRRSRRKSAP
jgi:hypothetical protein